jgi:hypothetical protein
MTRRLHMGVRVLLGSIALLALVGGGSARAQGYSFSGAGTVGGGSSAYLPFGGTMSGFIPYSPGPGGGLGVQPPMANSAMQMPPGGMTMPGTRPSLGSIRSRLTPLTPIGSLDASRGGRMGMTGPIIRGAPAGGGMGGMVRPPVGGYPFRQPPALIGPGSAPAMSM